MNQHYPAVAQRAAHRCEYCHAPEAIFNFPFEVEHVIPVSRGGADAVLNLALACRSCNLHKADSISGVDEATGNVVPLFHPRDDFWDEHFQADTATGELRGLTPTGCATVSALQMNSPDQLSARRLWMRLGLFP